MSFDSFPYETSWSPVDQSFLWRGPASAISWTPFFRSEQSDLWWVSDQNAALWLPLGRANISQLKKKPKKTEKNNALEMVPDETQLRSKTFLIWPKCAQRGSDQTQVRSKLPLIRPMCGRMHLWSDFSDKIDLWSDHLETIVQNVVRSNFLPDPVILVWEHTGVRSTGSDHKPIWVWTSTWVSQYGYKEQKYVFDANSYLIFSYL